MPLASYEQAELDAQNRRNDRIAGAVQSAHERFMQGRRNFMESNPNAVSNFERKAVLGRAQDLEDRSSLRDHEMRMLEQTGKNEVAVAEQKKLGMIGQGRDAAQANANATIKSSENNLAGKKYEVDASQAIAKDRNATELTIAEKKIAGDLAVEKERQGGAIDIAETQGKNAIAVEKEKGVQSRSVADAQMAAQQRVFDQQEKLQKMKDKAAMQKKFAELKSGNPQLTDDQIWAWLKRDSEQEG